MLEEAKAEKVNAQTIRKLEHIFQNLRSKNDKVREKAAQELRRTCEVPSPSPRFVTGHHPFMTVYFCDIIFYDVIKLFILAFFAPRPLCLLQLADVADDLMIF